MFDPSPSRSFPPNPPSKGASARHASAWTPQLEQRAVRLYLVEGFTAAEVADALGPTFSRAAVVSKMRRLGRLKRDHHAIPCSPSASHRVGKPRTGPRRAARLPPQRPPQPLPPLRETGPTGSPVPLASLPRDACRWPIDDPGAGRMHLALFCGGPAAGHVYCAAHRALAFRRPK